MACNFKKKVVVKYNSWGKRKKMARVRGSWKMEGKKNKKREVGNNERYGVKTGIICLLQREWKLKSRKKNL